jgi:hypothetical protein
MPTAGTATIVSGSVSSNEPLIVIEPVVVKTYVLGGIPGPSNIIFVAREPKTLPDPTIVNELVLDIVIGAIVPPKTTAPGIAVIITGAGEPTSWNTPTVI